jgi:hypothetical protein
LDGFAWGIVGERLCQALVHRWDSDEAANVLCGLSYDWTFVLVKVGVWLWLRLGLFVPQDITNFLSERM